MHCWKMVMTDLFAEVDNHAKNLDFQFIDTKHCLGKDLNRLYKDLNIHSYYSLDFPIGHTNDGEPIYLVSIPKNCNLDYI